jgi:hypothetical protein
LLCIHAVPSFCGVSILHVICVARIDVGMMLFSCYYVPCWCVSFYVVGLAECVTSYYKAAHEYITSDVLQQMSFHGGMTKMEHIEIF